MEMKDGWGVTHERGTKVVKWYYLEKIYNNILNYRLVKNVIAYVPFLSVDYKNDHFDILSAIDLYEN